MPTQQQIPTADKEKPNKKDIWDKRKKSIQAAIRNVPRSFKLVWEAHRPSTIAMAIVTFISAMLPATQAWVAKLIVDQVVISINTGLNPHDGLMATLPLLFIEFVLITLSSALNQARSLIEHILHMRTGHAINTAIMRTSITLDLTYFEDADFYDKLQNARRESDWRALAIINTGFLAMQNFITLLSFALILLSFSPIIALILLGATMPSFIAQAKYSNLYFRLLTWRTPETRRMVYLEHLLTVDTSVKEIKLFGLGIPLLKRYEDMFWKFYFEDKKLAQRRSIVSVLWGLVATSSYYGAYAWIVWITMHGNITLGDMILYISVFRQTQAIFHGLFHNLSQIYEHGLFMDNLFMFLELQPRIVASSKSLPIPRPIKQGIEFRGVSFRYPDQEHWALRNVNLSIEAGEALALVGSNGAGKTTLIKLLTRLYDPTEGHILIDGIDLREYDVDDLRANIGVIFQDFVHYYTTARENIGFGNIDAIEDDAQIISASKRGGADEVIETLPQGYETMLGRWFSEGRELSGGQWQKIALGRAFMRDSEVLVLDEPTAALDAEREYEIFQRFRDLTKGRTALLISHRFSTVRMADRIAVLKDGQVAELGTHQELLELGGDYARLFNLQAEGYR